MRIRVSSSFPRFPRILQFHAIGEAQTLLVSEAFNTLLHGKLNGDLLPLLDGAHSLDAILATLDGAHAADDILTAITSLSAKGYVVSGDHGMELRQAAYWSSLGASPRWVEQRLKDSAVAVEGDDGRLTRHLIEGGARLGSGDLNVVVCEDYLDARLAEVNRRQIDARTPWLLVRPHGMEALFGPVFRAEDREPSAGEREGLAHRMGGPCWECLAYRLRNHREVHGFLRHVAGEEAAFKPFAAEPSVLDALYRLIAAEIIKWIVLGDAAPIHDHAITMNVGAFASSRHRVTRRPQCRACGDEALYRPDRPAAPVCLRASPKTHHNSGGSRAVEPEVTLAKYRALGESDQWRRILAQAHHTRGRFLAACVLGR